MIATTSTAEKAERLKALGASDLINYTDARITAGKRCQRPTRNTGVKLAVNAPIIAEAVISVRTT